MGDEGVGPRLDQANLRLDLANLCPCLPTAAVIRPPSPRYSTTREEEGGAHLDVASIVVHAPPLPPPCCSIPIAHTVVGEGEGGANREKREGVASEKEERDSLVRGEGAYIGWRGAMASGLGMREKA